MSTLTAPDFRLVGKIKDERFDVEDLQNYALSIQIGNKDLQFCVTDVRSNQCLLLEDFVLEGVKTINGRIEVIKKLFESHHLLMAGFWNSIRVAMKTHKFSLVPSSHFDKDSVVEYLVVNSEINPKIEEVYYYRHIKSSAINVFSADKKLMAWLNDLYANKNVQIVHQGSALIEGILRNDDHSRERMMFCLMDKGILHVVVTHQQKLLYYNQFAVRISNDYLKYVMLVFKELGLSQKETKLLVWGNISQQSPHVLLMKKYIRHISFGSRPSFLKFNFEFDQVPDHQYFDLMSVFLCD